MWPSYVPRCNQFSWRKSQGQLWAMRNRLHLRYILRYSPFFTITWPACKKKVRWIILSSMSHIYILTVEVCLAVLYCYDNISFSKIKTGEYFTSVWARDIFKFVWECKVQLSNICFTLLHVIQFVLGWVVDLSSKLLAGKKIVLFGALPWT